MKRLFLSLVAATATMSSAAAAQSIAGEWDAAMNTPGGVRNFKIVFQMNGDTLTGTVNGPPAMCPWPGPSRATS